MIEAWAPGKVIVLGEHGVVYGQPALAAAISRGVRATAVGATRASVELPRGGTAPQRAALQRAFARAVKRAGNPKVQVTLESDLPLSVGLGSSGALSVAVARVLLEARHGVATTQRQLEALALEMEKEFHGTPSGVDHTTSARGGMVLFQKGTARPVRCAKPIKVLVTVVGERASTKDTVAALRARQAKWPARYRRIFKEIGTLAREGAAAAGKGDLPLLGDLMNMNQGLLSSLGLSSEPLEAMVHQLRRHGALGAKLTGAGGDGGAVIALFQEPEPVVMRLRAAGIECFTSQLGGPFAL